MISKSGKTLALALLTMFGIGRIKYAPGTVASLVTCLIFYLCYRDVVLWTKIIWFLDVGSNKLGGIFLFFILSFICSFILIDKLSVHFKKKDPQEIVIDEFFGQSIPLLSLGIYAMYNNIVLIWTYRYIELFIFLSFILFRIFDIYKPFPINIIDKNIKNGLGVMLDDIVAGIYATLVVIIIFIFFT